MKIAIGYNTSHYAWMFRENLIKKLIEKGNIVIIIAPLDEYSINFEKIGVKHIDIKIKMNRNIFSDINIIKDFFKIFKKENVDIYLGYTIKPNIYGSIAAYLLGIKIINNIAGLGSTFINRSITTVVVQYLYKIALFKSDTVFFQNKDDLNLFLEKKIIKHKNFDLIPGSGVDLIKYNELVFKKPENNFIFLLIGRILFEKGIREYVEAARIIKLKNKNVIFQLLGPIDSKNPSTIPASMIEEWHSMGIINYIGVSADVRKEIAIADCVVLPSYREGTPRSLLEAAAMGKPLITTNSVGCREVVEHNYNGFLCNTYDHVDLANKMMQLMSLPHSKIQQMGQNSRKKVESQFSEEIVIDKYLKLISKLK